MPNSKIKQIQVGSSIYDIEPAETQEVNIIDNVTSTSSTDVLSAKQGKVLNDKISAIEGRGRYLSLWNANLGQPNDLPGGGSSTTEVYNYKSGDYFIVKVAGSKIPSGTSIPVGTTIATFPNITLTEEEKPWPEINDSIYFNGTSWSILHTPAGTGDVTGPASSTDNDLVSFDGTTGKVIKDSGIKSSDIVTTSKTAASGGTDLSLVTTGEKYNWNNHLDTDVKLSTQLKTYYNIGKVTTASGTNPVVIGNAGDSIRDVLNNLTQMDEIQPTITNEPSLSVSFSRTTTNPQEYGIKISTINYSITTNDGDYTYESTTGVKFSPDDTTKKYNFSGGTSTTGDLTEKSGNLTLSEDYYIGVSSAVAITCVGTHSAGNVAKTNLGNISNPPIQIAAGSKSDSSKTFSYSGYKPSLIILSTSTPSTFDGAQYRGNGITGTHPVSGGSSSTYMYVIVPSSQSISSIKAGGFDVPFSQIESSKSYVVNNDKSTTFKVYKTSGAVIADTFVIM